MTACVWCGREASPTSERTWCQSCEDSVCQRCGDEPTYGGEDICETCEGIAEIRRQERLREEEALWTERCVDEIRDRMAAERAERGAA